MGSLLTVRLARRMVTSNGRRRQWQLFLAGMIGGTTIWSTHFVAMLAYNPGYPHGYEPVLTLLSLAVAFSGVLASLAILAYWRSAINLIAGGFLLGLSIAAMHYMGMLAYKLPGELVWDASILRASILFGGIFSALAFHRVKHPTTKYCWIGGGILMFLAINAVHFIGMTAFEIELSPLVEVPEQILPDTTLGIMVFGVTTILFFVGFVGMSIETNVEKEALARVDHIASHDQLTGLPNRVMLTRKADGFSKALAEDPTYRLAVVSIDLRKFKEINDLRGNRAGDAVLIQIARRLLLSCDSGEVVARTGGDEFVVVKPGLRRLDEVRAFCDRLLAQIAEPIMFHESPIAVSVAIGVASSLEDGTEFPGLLQKADLAMHRAKATPGFDCIFYNSEIDRQNRDRLVLLNDLRHAASRGELELYYQLQNDVCTGAGVGFEALLRWNHPDRGRISPSEFIPLAEESGLIRDLGLWVMKTACREAARWDRPLGIAVNVSPQQLAQPSFVEQLSDILIETALAPERLEIEITEASIIDDQDHALKIMHRIRKMGVRIAMDDFGTGFSSLAMLQAFPFDKIKIDQGFIRDVHLFSERAAIVRATLLLGNALKIPVLAEGVEVANELSFLRRERCQFVQGFFFGKPMPVEEARALACDASEAKVS
ncbi:putative bifunctional diguanylate cyclase/phosphodiesterase [Poseidonocella sedimentorum]